MPSADQVPLFALLRRRLSDEDVVALAEELAATGALPVDGIDIRVAITKLTDEMPSAAEFDRVKQGFGRRGVARRSENAGPWK